eukprot:scaffold14739_cov107-Isochrysis_galbana.AAC.3
MRDTCHRASASPRAMPRADERMLAEHVGVGRWGVSTAMPAPGITATLPRLACSWGAARMTRARPRASGPCRIRGAAKFRPITVTDVQSDGRPLALPGDSPSSPHVRAAVAAARD